MSVYSIYFQSGNMFSVLLKLTTLQLSETVPYWGFTWQPRVQFRDRNGSLSVVRLRESESVDMIRVWNKRMKENGFLSSYYLLRVDGRSSWQLIITYPLCTGSSVEVTVGILLRSHSTLTHLAARAVWRQLLVNLQYQWLRYSVHSLFRTFSLKLTRVKLSNIDRGETIYLHCRV